MTALRELAERWRATNRGETLYVEGKTAGMHMCAAELLAILDAEGDSGSVACGYLITWNDPTYRGRQTLSFDRCSPDDGSFEPVYTQPAQSVAIYPVGHFIETSAGEYARVSRKHECDGDVFQLYRSTGNAQSVDVEKVPTEFVEDIQRAERLALKSKRLNRERMMGLAVVKHFGHLLTAALQEKGNG